MTVLTLALPTSLPIRDPVLIVAIAMSIFLIIPYAFERMRLPGLIGLIIAGAIIGPNATGILERDTTIVLLGTVGLLYLMFTAGLDIDLHGFARYRSRSVVFGALSFLLPQLAGTALGLLFGYGWATALLLGSVIASHTLLAYPIAARLGIAKNEAVTTAVGGTIVADTAALLVLAVIAASTAGALDTAFWLRLVISLAIFAAIVMLVLPLIARWFFRHQKGEAVAEYIFVMLALFASAFLAEVAGVEAIIGAFLAGLALNRLIPGQGPLMNRINFFGNAFFIPFFLLSVGMLVDVRVLVGSPRALVVALGMTLGVVSTKFLAARVAGRLYGYTREEGWTMFALTVPQAAATLAAVMIGIEVGLFDEVVLNGSILVILVTCILGPWLVQRHGRGVALLDRRRPYEPSEAPQRILIPIANPATSEGLMDLAFLIRDPGSGQSLYPLTVVRPLTEETAAQVAEAEKVLAHAVIYAAGAEVPVVPLTRVDENFAIGILRGVVETRSSTMVIGWDGNRKRGIFGSVLDQLVEQSRQQLIVARLEHPIGTTERLVLVVPPRALHDPGNHAVLQDIKRIANQLGATVLALIVDSDTAELKATLEGIRPSVPVEYERVAGWAGLHAALQQHLSADDLTVLMSARNDTIAWDRHLDEMPAQLASSTPASFLVFYPREMEGAGQPALPPESLPAALVPDRIIHPLPATSAREALTTMLESAFEDAARQEEAAELLMHELHEYSTEIQPGIVVPNARVDSLDRVTVILGVSEDGIDFPGGRAPAHLVFLVLSPSDAPVAHLESLAGIARLVRERPRFRALLEDIGVPELVGSDGALSLPD